MSKTYIFISFASVVTRKAVGACVLEGRHDQIEDKLQELDMDPEESLHLQVSELDEEEFKEQGMDLNRFYTSKELAKMEFEKA